MYRPIIVGLALREDDAAPISLARVLARVTGAPLTLATVVPVEVVLRRVVHGEGVLGGRGRELRLDGHDGGEGEGRAGDAGEDARE